MVNQFHIIAFTHRNFDVNKIGKLHIDAESQKDRLNHLKESLDLTEVMFLSTCNRVEFLFCTDCVVNTELISRFFFTLYPELHLDDINEFTVSGQLYSGMAAVEHVFRVASSIDSMIVGEREIITQVRTAFENCRDMGLTGDTIRVIMRQTVSTAKRVYTETAIARKPVSVVALAYHTLRDMNMPLNSRILVIGAGTTNNNMGKFLKKHGYQNFAVFNRTISKAETLASELNGSHFPLSALSTYDKGFDLIISCTGAENHVITPEIYSHLLQGETTKKVVIDIAIPHDLDSRIVENNPVTHISVDVLQKISAENLKERSKEITHVEEILSESITEFTQILRMRSVEVAMREVPNMVKQIRSAAVNEVFKKDLQLLDDESREVLDKIIGYMEKKYMSMPMKMAKEIMMK
jgi:glutamyl-tRNA reductase